MDWEQWKPRYLDIIERLGLSQEEDMRSARLLQDMRQDLSGPGMLEGLIRGREVMVFGPAPFHGTDPGDRILISAGSATKQVLEKGIRPHVVVTDLDGDVAAQVGANKNGAAAVIHAHGDNTGAIERWAPEFTGRIIGTTQAKPFGDIHNFGGFTDGDRAVFLALHFGASKIILWGFEFENPAGKPVTDRTRKLEKLAIARELICWAREVHKAEIVFE